MELFIENLSKKRGARTIFKGLNISLKTGDTLALKGGNGVGKTSFLNLISGFDKDFEGKITCSEKVDIGYVPQEIVLFEKLSVKDNLKIFCNPAKNIDIMNLVERLDFAPLLKKKVSKLSGGQKRLINFVAGLINKPDIILLDEAIVGMDTDLVNKIVYYINEIKDEKIIIVISHQENFLREICNKKAEFIAGKLEIEDEY